MCVTWSRWLRFHQNVETLELLSPGLIQVAGELFRFVRINVEYRILGSGPLDAKCLALGIPVVSALVCPGRQMCRVFQRICQD
jgi:hypothetical protein